MDNAMKDFMKAFENLKDFSENKVSDLEAQVKDLSPEEKEIYLDFKRKGNQAVKGENPMSAIADLLKQSMKQAENINKK